MPEQAKVLSLLLENRELQRQVLELQDKLILYLGAHTRFLKLRNRLLKLVSPDSSSAVHAYLRALRTVDRCLPNY